MQLRVTRPGFIEGMRAYKASQGESNYDVNTMATRQEMRSFVCGQCHVEYYFKGPEKRLVYPWAKGLKVGRHHRLLRRSQSQGLDARDTGAPVLKAQHPEFEMWNQGIHARSGVACADCHMPYKREGALKISDHHVRSPLLNINRSCQTCHKWSEERIESARRDDSEPSFQAAQSAMDALVDLIGDLKAAQGSREERGRIDAPRKTSSARRSFIWILSKRKTPRASTRRRKPRAFWANPSTSRGKGKKRCAALCRLQAPDAKGCGEVEEVSYVSAQIVTRYFSYSLRCSFQRWRSQQQLTPSATPTPRAAHQNWQRDVVGQFAHTV